MVMAEEEKILMERAARRAGMSLSEWLREAAREKLRGSGPPSLTTAGELKAFFSECDEREVGREPDWDSHREVIDASKKAEAPGS